MKCINRLSALLIFLTVLVMSCSSDDDATTGGEQEMFNFSGTVVDDTNVPIQNAIITLGEFTTRTDVNGEFTLNNIELDTNFAYIKAAKDDYVTGMRMITNLEGNNTAQFALFNDHLSTILGTGGNSVVTFPTGFTLTIDGNVNNEDGSPFSGFMYPVIYHAELSNHLIEDIVPGNYSIKDTTYGFVYIKLEDSEKNILDIAEGHKGYLYFHINDDKIDTAPQKIIAYNFNIESGEWEIIGEATKELFLGSWSYKLTTTSFSSHWFKVQA